MQTVLITLHGEELGSVVPAPEGVLPHAAVERHVVIRVNDYFGARHIANMYFTGPLLTDGKEVLGYYIVESDEAGDEDLVFKLEDFTMKKEQAFDKFLEEHEPPKFTTLSHAVTHKLHALVCKGSVFICSKCSQLQQGGGTVKTVKYDNSGGVFIVEAACNSCSRLNTLREVRTYSILFELLQKAVSEINLSDVAHGDLSH